MRTLMRLLSVLFTAMSCVASAEPVFDIHPDGHARMYSTEKRDMVQWIVRCTRPMRDCSARSPRALIRTLDGRVTLSFYSANETAPLILLKDSTEAWTHNRLSQLSAEDMEELGADTTFVVLSGDRGPETLLQLTGLVDVVDYLKWLNSDTARAIRDARVWPAGDDLDPDSLEKQALFRYNELLRRKRISVPDTQLMMPMIQPM